MWEGEKYSFEGGKRNRLRKSMKRRKKEMVEGLEKAGK